MELDLDLKRFYDQEENIKIEDGSIESLVYATLIGKGESRITGSMKNWNVKTRISSMLEIVSALFLSGDFDTIPYQEYESLRSFATVKIISGAGHAPFYETPGEFWGAVSQFLDRIIQK
jgi:pimeloyl-ACP methyl ester carboxylesterase